MEVNFEKWATDLCSLLDAIEMALRNDDTDRALELVMGRFQIAEDNGLEIRALGTDPAGMQ